MKTSIITLTTDFSMSYAARTLETVNCIPMIGNHVCVVDPGVGTKRKPIIIRTRRGDNIIGPDNGILIPATHFLGGIKKVVGIENEKYMNLPVSPVFHGRDIFAPAAAYLSREIRLEDFGRELTPDSLAKAPYDEAKIDGRVIQSEIISINKFGSLHLNIRSAAFDGLGIRSGEIMKIKLPNETLNIPFATAFGDVRKGMPLILKDDYGRMEIALNQGSFAKEYGSQLGDKVNITAKYLSLAR